MKRDYYRVLDVKQNASPDEIQRAYRALAMRYHPDRNPAPEAVLRMTSINEAYEVLGDPERRRRYDSQTITVDSGKNLAGPILAAARETIMRSGWSTLQDTPTSLLLEKSSNRVRIVFIDRLNNASLSRICRQYTDRTVVLAVDVETPINLGLQTVVVDLMHCRRHGSRFGPAIEEGLQSLIAPFL
jgi:curved DNA-binding protein CbpA